MIPLYTWFSQILGYCELVANDDQLQQAWIRRDMSSTSVSDFVELYEQIFDDLDSDSLENELTKKMGNMSDATIAIKEFLKVLRHINTHYLNSRASPSNEVLLASPEWKGLQESAREALRCGSEAGVAKTIL